MTTLASAIDRDFRRVERQLDKLDRRAARDLADQQRARSVRRPTLIAAVAPPAAGSASPGIRRVPVSGRYSYVAR